jgi:predicted HTH domain antitoxin
MSQTYLEVEAPAAIKGTPFEEKFIETAQQVIVEQTVLRLFEKGEISSGYGAELLGLSRWEFIELLGKRGIPFLSYDDEDWKTELQSVEQMNKTLADKRMPQ